MNAAAARAAKGLNTAVAGTGKAAQRCYTDRDKMAALPERNVFRSSVATGC